MMQAVRENISTALPFGEWLKRRRKTLDLTREKLAWRVGCSFETIKKIEAGDLKPSAQLAEIIATKLDVPPVEHDAFVRFARSDTVAEPSAFTGAAVASSAPAPTAPSSPGTPLPAPLTGLLGRARELRAARELLQRDHVRLLTLTGAPGAGKTRLALALAAERGGEFAQGVVFVPLASVNDPALVLSSIAQAFHLPEVRNEPLAVTLSQALRSRQTLIVLDNFEQVILAAPQIGELLTAAPGIKVIVTSREVLHVYGEHEFPVPPLELPDAKLIFSPETLEENPAIALFVARARAAKPDFELNAANADAVARLCVLLDGLPLALEMAAVQIKRSSPARLLGQLEARLVGLSGGLRDLSPRQQTLRGALDWSYNLLNAEEQQAFRRLGVFATGGELDAVARVLAEVEDGREAAREMLASLADKNLVRVSEDQDAPRYGMLETIHDYAREKLSADPELEMVRRQHARYFIELAAAVSPGTQEDAAKFDLLERERDNLRAAVHWALEQEDPTIALSACSSLGPFWTLRGCWGEGLQQTRRALARVAGATTDKEQLRLKAKVLRLAAQLAERQEGDAVPRTMYQESLQLHRELGDEAALIQALHAISTFYFMHGEHDAARNSAHEALALARVRQDPHATARLLNHLGRLELVRLRHEQARVYLQESIVLSRAAADKANAAGALYQLGNAALAEGKLADAQRELSEAHELYRAVGDVVGTRAVLVSMGWTAVLSGDFDHAREWLDSSLELAHTLNDRYGEAYSLHGLGRLDLSRGNLVEARRNLQASLELAREIGANTGAGRLARTYLGYLALAEGDEREAYACATEMLVAWGTVEDQEGQARALSMLGFVALGRGETERAQTYFDQQMAAARATDKFPNLAEALFDTGYFAFKRNDLKRAVQAYQEMVRRAMDADAPRALSLALLGLGAVLDESDPARATTLLGASAALREKFNVPLGGFPRAVRQDFVRAEQRARERIDAEGINQAWLTGQTLSVEEVVALANAESGG